ncbi:MAG: hypothetical protein WC804_18470 [Sphingomonas sp.]|jgi:hypothetical protein
MRKARQGRPQKRVPPDDWRSFEKSPMIVPTGAVATPGRDLGYVFAMTDL